MTAQYLASCSNLGGHRPPLQLRHDGFINVLPPNEPALEPCYPEFHNYHDDTQDKHSRVYARGIEISLDLTDDPSESLCCRQVFADDGADERETDRCVKAR